MARSLTPALNAEMDKLDRTPSSQVVVERWLPEWTARISGLSGGATEQYACGHSLGVAVGGNGAGEDILFRARSGSFASPTNGTLYIAVIKGTTLDNPASWDGQWVSTGITSLMAPAWTANSGASHGGSLAVVISGTTGRVFYLKANGDFQYIDVNLTNASIGSPVQIDNLGTGRQLASMHVAASRLGDCFVLMPQLVEAGLAAWHKEVWGSFIRRYSVPGTITQDNSFWFLTHAEAGLLRDGPLEGDDFSSTSAEGVTGQWGKRLTGGMAAVDIDSTRTLIVLGMTFWRKWGYDTHWRGVTSFIFHRSGNGTFWERGPEVDGADFNEDNQLSFVSSVSICTVEGRKFLVWNRFTEPSDHEQSVGAITFPRIVETVYARIADDGRSISQFQHLGNPDELTAGSLAALNHGGSKRLYAVGWRSVFESDPAAYVCDATAGRFVLSDDYAAGWSLTRNNRQGMTIDLNLRDPAIILDPDSIVKAGNLVRILYGLPGNLVQIGQGFIDQDAPNLSIDREGTLQEEASVGCRAEDILLNTRTETIEDILPQDTMYVEPTDPVKHVTLSEGHWVVARMQWPGLFFSGAYASLNAKTSWRLKSFPYANFGGEGGAGDPGKILNEREEYKGSWFKDITWLGMPPMVDGAIEATVRWGDNWNQGNFSFQTDTGDNVSATVQRFNGVISIVTWDGGGAVNEVRQHACMAGLLCHAPEVGRKYAFVWEHQSDFSLSSHTNDQWSGENFDSADYSAHGLGFNKLYLIVSDYDGANTINKSVAGGITATGLEVGKPADLRMQVLGGRIYCYYRPHSTGTPNQWQLAFSYRAGRFGAGRFGLIGRGHAGIQWDALYNGKVEIGRLENYVDFWNIKLSDAVMDQTIEEHLRRYAWRGYTESVFRSEVSEASRPVSGGGFHNYSRPVENLTIDFKVNIPANGNEAGVFLRGVSPSVPQNQCVRLGIIPHSTANTSGNPVNYYIVKRRFSGTEVTSAREYAPFPIQIKPGSTIPVRVTAQGAIYSLWIAGNYAGHFIDETELGLYFGLYAIGGTATFSDIYVPELYEVTSGLLEVNQAVGDALGNVIGSRRIKSIYTWDGKLKFSYYLTREQAPDFHENRLWQSGIQRNPRYLSKVRVQGTDAYAIYQAETLAKKGQRFQLVSKPEITLREFAYREAQAIVTETAEQQQKASFTGAPDIRVDPEDETIITINRQNVNGSFIIEDIRIDFTMGDDPASSMQITTRQTVAL